MRGGALWGEGAWWEGAWWGEGRSGGRGRGRRGRGGGRGLTSIAQNILLILPALSRRACSMSGETGAMAPFCLRFNCSMLRMPLMKLRAHTGWSGASSTRVKMPPSYLTQTHHGDDAYLVPDTHTSPPYATEHRLERNHERD